MTGSPFFRRSNDSEGRRTVQVRAQRPGDAAGPSSNFMPGPMLRGKSLAGLGFHDFSTRPTATTQCPKRRQSA